MSDNDPFPAWFRRVDRLTDVVSFVIAISYGGWGLFIAIACCPLIGVPQMVVAAALVAQLRVIKRYRRMVDRYQRRDATELEALRP